MTVNIWQIGDRCHAPKDTRTLIIVGFLGHHPDGDPIEAELTPATGPRGPRRWCNTDLLTEVGQP